MAGQTVLQIIGSAAFATVFVAIINAVVNRKKLGAEATKVITDAAGTTVKNYGDDNARLRKENEKLQERVAHLEKAIRHCPKDKCPLDCE